MRQGILSISMLAGVMLIATSGQTATAQPELSDASIPVMLPESVTRDYDIWVDRIRDLRSSLEKNQGFLRLKGDLVDVLVFDRESGRKMLMTRYQASLESAAVELPPEFFGRSTASRFTLVRNRAAGSRLLASHRNNSPLGQRGGSDQPSPEGYRTRRGDHEHGDAGREGGVWYIVGRSCRQPA